MRTAQYMACLAWSLDDVKEAVGAACIVVPLTPEAVLAARDAVGLDVVLPEELLESFSSLWAEISACANSVAGDLIEMTNEQSWLASAAGKELFVDIGHVLIWSRILQALRRRAGKATLRIVPPQAFQDPSQLRSYSWDHRLQKAFLVVAASMASRGELVVSWRNRDQWCPLHPAWQRWAKMTLLSAIGRFVMGSSARLLSSEETQASRAGCRGITLLLAGLQATDGVHQAGLAARLANAWGERFLWLRFGDALLAGTAFTPEEKAGQKQDSMERGRHRLAEDIPPVLWRRKTYACVADAYNLWTLAGILRKRVGSRLSRADWAAWLRHRGYSGLTEQYARWARLLERLHPKVIVGLSVLEDMAYVRAWARQKESVPFVLLPHGIFPTVHLLSQVDGDVLGVFGDIMRQQVENSGLAVGRPISICGPMFFAEKIERRQMPAVPRIRNTPPMVLYPASYGLFPFFPAPLSGCERMLRSCLSACRGAGAVLVVREHPRGGMGTWRHWVDALAREYPGAIRLSANASLFDDLNASSVVVSDCFDGAVMDALMARVPFIPFVPEGVFEPSLEVLERSGSLVRDGAQLERALQGVIQSEEQKRAFMERQESFMAQLVGCSGKTAWEDVEHLVQQVLSVEVDRVTSTLPQKQEPRGIGSDRPRKM